MTEAAPQEFWQSVEEFNNREYYACHDTLEALWMESAEPEKKFYQGVLQIAVALYHLGNRNWRGAVTLLGEGIKKLRYYQPTYVDIDVDQLVEQSDQLLSALQQAGAEKIAEFVQHFETTDTYPGGDTTLQVPKIVKKYFPVIGK
ncbi:DUF309 domain-containing protein [Argonema antarcticum]|uniref:DUF309 domain-containing protein n=1 Tax=Argonema antarcticum TaxID=2942763 RepID=UPI002010DE9D|nr:DUF309 domain-containing protein [Argonema antarcticum]MCL1474376.1 DUF309 domain-containing protein [Argonema antarcticum A004/B2]